MPRGINRVSTEAKLSSSIGSSPLPQQPRSASNKFALTEQRITDLKAVGSTIYVHDARMPGLSVRVTKAGVKSYVFTKKVNGRFLRVTIGKTASMALSAARNAASAHHGDIAKGVDIAAMRKSAKAAAGVKARTLADAYERFLTLKDRRPTRITKGSGASICRTVLSANRWLTSRHLTSKRSRRSSVAGRRAPPTRSSFCSRLSWQRAADGQTIRRVASNASRNVSARVGLMPKSWRGSGRRWTAPPETCGLISSNF
jgi:hypothetical protein